MENVVVTRDLLESLVNEVSTIIAAIELKIIGLLICEVNL
jgi:hypothetical protein